MSLRSSAVYEIGWLPLHTLLCSNRHSRAGGNPGSFPAELAWIPAFAGMTEHRWPHRYADHSQAQVFSKEDTKSTKFGVITFRNLRVLRDLRGEICFPNFVPVVLLSMIIPAACANFWGAEDPSDSDMPRAKNAKDAK